MYKTTSGFWNVKAKKRREPNRKEEKKYETKLDLRNRQGIKIPINFLTLHNCFFATFNSRTLLPLLLSSYITMWQFYFTDLYFTQIT